jgi:RNA polymerase sigma-70 factor (ECF subfamily)
MSALERPLGSLADRSMTAAVPDAADDDTALVEALRRGDPDAYEALLRTHGGRLLAVARRLLRHDEDARDAVQEAFLLAFRGLPSFAGRCRLSTWLHRIVVNTALMKIRQRERKPEAPIDDLLPEYQPDGHHVVEYDEWRLPAPQKLLREEVRAQVHAAIDRLPESYRTVLLLRDIDEMDTPEVAALLSVTPNAVKIRLHRARQALRTLLDPVFARRSAEEASRVATR